MNHFYAVHQMSPSEDGRLQRRLVGKFMIHDGGVHILCDYHDMLDRSLCGEGKLDPRRQRALDRLFSASYYDIQRKPGPFDVVTHSPGTIQEKVLDTGDPNGELEDAVPTIAPQRPPPVFDYMREGFDRPRTIEISQGVVLLDGQALSPAESQQVIENVRNGVATIRYRQSLQPVQAQPQSTLAKYEQLFMDLHKAEGLANSLEALRALVASGHLKQEHYDHVRRELYHDEMIPSIGNKRAFKEFMLKPDRGGVHIMLDANDFKSINDELSHEHGDAAIKAMGNAIRTAVDKHVGSDVAAAHRFGGDEFHVHVPTHEHAAKFLRGLRQELEAIPAIGGTHKLSMSAGIGLDPHSADKALNEGAKTQKKAAVAALGGDPDARVGSVRAPHSLYAHSAVPGFEGPVPTSHEQLPLAPPGHAQKLATEAPTIHAGKTASASVSS